MHSMAMKLASSKPKVGRLLEIGGAT